MCIDSLNWALWVVFHGRYWYQSFIDGSNIMGVDRIDPWDPEIDHPPLGRSYLVVVPSYDMSCAFYFHNETLWVRFHGWYWYQSFIDVSNIGGVSRTDPWGPELGHPPLGRSYLVVVRSNDMSCALILFYLDSMGGIPWSILISIIQRLVQYLGCGLDRPLRSRNEPSAIGQQLFGSSAVVWYVMCLLFSLRDSMGFRFHGWYWYQSFIDASNIWGASRTDPWGPEMGHPPLGRNYFVVVPSYDTSGALIFLSGPYGWDLMADIDIDSSSMGPIFGVWIGPTLGVPKWTIRHWAAAIW